MAFNSRDLMVSIAPAQNLDATCPELTIPTGCYISAGAESGEADGLVLLQRQLRMALSQPPV